MGFGKDGKGFILYDHTEAALGALASLDVLNFVGRYSNTLLEDFRMIKMEYWMQLQGNQNITLENGPVLIGIADGTMTAAEIEECLESSPFDSNDLPESEQTMRPVWPLEMFNILDVDAGNGSTIHGAIHGEKTMRWTFKNTSGWQWWAYNLGTGLTTGSFAVAFAKIYGVWVP